MGACPPADGPDGETLVALGMAASIQLSQGRTADELELLSAFFEVLGDNLALIAARRANQEIRKARYETEKPVKSS